jgi:hypothetical protein
MRDLNATVGPAKEPTAAPFDYSWAVGAAAAMAGSAMLLWASVMRSAAIQPCAMSAPTMRLWYVTPYGVPFGAAAAWTAWHNAFGTPAAWWLAPVPGFAGRSDVAAIWGSALAAIGLAVMRAWVAPPDAARSVVVLCQTARDHEQNSQPVAETTPYSAYRTDGGHAAAQITVMQLGMDRGDRPCAGNAARSRRDSRVLH